MGATFAKLLVIAVVATLLFVHDASAQGALDVSQLALPGGPVQTNFSPRIFGLRGEISIVVQLVDPPLAVVHGKNAKKVGGRLSPAQQRDYLVQLGQKQDTLLA